MKKTNTKTTDIIKIICIIIFALIILFIVIGAGYFTGMYTAASQEIKGIDIKGMVQNIYSGTGSEDEDIIDIDNSNDTTNIDNSDETDPEQPDMAEEEQGWVWVESEDMPKLMKEAVIAVEDENFYLHKGFDTRNDGRTITQQLIKCVMSDEDDSNRMKTVIRSILFEKELTKDEILTAYMNSIYFADNCYGVRAVADAYYGTKDLNALTIAQTAAIAGMIRNPLESEPFNHSYENIERRNYTLEKMYDLGKITKSEYEAAITEKAVTSGEDIDDEDDDKTDSPASSGSPAPSGSPVPSGSPAPSRKPN